MGIDLSSSIPSLSQAASAGLDPDELLASGDPHGMLAAKLAGVPYQPQRVQSAQSTGISQPAQWRQCSKHCTANQRRANHCPAGEPGCCALYGYAQRDS